MCRNPHSVAAAVIYLAFNLEDQKKTQTEVCKACSPPAFLSTPRDMSQLLIRLMGLE